MRRDGNVRHESGLKKDDFDSRPSVAVFDATNTSRKRRKWIVDNLSGTVVESNKNIVFVESVCDDQSIVEANIRAVKLKMPDYSNLGAEEAVSDFSSA